MYCWDYYCWNIKYMEEINDIRNEQEFKIITFSGFKKTEVMRELLKSLIKGK